MNIDRQQIQQLVRDVAFTTLLPLTNNVSRDYKKDGSIVTAADRAVQNSLSKRLADLYPDIALLGEEMSVEQQQQLFDSGKPIWCLDPIDGTSNFASGLPFYSISLALIEQGEVTFAIVLDPSRDESFTAVRGEGAWLNDLPLRLTSPNLSLDNTIAFVDFKRLPPDLALKLVKDRPFASQRNLGSIALELCWLAAGRGHIYLHGSQQIWDYAAGDLILEEAGGFASTLYGNPSFRYTLEPRSSCAAIDEALFQAWQNYLLDAVNG